MLTLSNHNVTFGFMLGSARLGSGTMKCALAFLAVALTAGFLTGTAIASTTNYWGYNNLTATNPPGTQCPVNGSPGIACSGWNNWDYSQVDWVSGRSSFAFGFICQPDGIVNARFMSGSESFGTYTVLWSDYCPGDHYVKAAVAHINGGSNTYNYLQGRALIFP
jgi:hypothetical protein